MRNSWRSKNFIFLAFISKKIIFLTLKYYQRIVGGFKNVPTFARVKSFSDSGLNAECFFNYLNITTQTILCQIRLVFV